MTSRRRFIRNLSAAGAATLLAKSNLKAGGFSPAADYRIFPPKLKTGDLIALTAPAGAVFNPDDIQVATSALEKAGFRVKQGNSLLEKYGYLAGTDDNRRQELEDLFTDKDVKGIIAMRGGWGCARLLQQLDFGKIAQSPKVFSGFSDISTLLLAIYARTGMITFHGPLGNSSWSDFTVDNFMRIVAEGEQLKMVQPANDPLTVYSEGEATGLLLGGNLTVLCSLIGTGYLPSFVHSILFLEETEEEPYAIDRKLTQLDLNTILFGASGIVFGKCTKCDAEKPDQSFTIDEVFRQKFMNLTTPVMTGFSIGHIKDKFTFPVGAQVHIDTAASSVTLLHPCVI